MTNSGSRGIKYCGYCNEIKNHCKCHPVTRNLHFGHLTDMIYPVKESWIKSGMVRIK